MFDATPVFRLYARHRMHQLDRADPVETQARQLRTLVDRAAHTRFGRDHGFDRIRTVADYRSAVPLRRYEDFWAEYWQDPFPRLTDVTWPGTIPYFAATSGTTTGRTKYIPVSREMVASNRKAALDLIVHHLNSRPESRVLGGLNFMLGGSTELVEQAPGICSGDLSGIAAREVPAWARPFYYPPPHLAVLSDWERKVDLMGRRSLDLDIRTIAGTASWLLLYFDRLAELAPERGRRIVDLYPNLELLVHGGVNFTPYRPAFDRLLEGSRAELREVYPASEGFIALADRGTGEGLRLEVDTGLFLEFVPAAEIGDDNPRRFWLGEVETGVNYAIVVTSNAGLWSYVLGDTVRFVDLDPPRLLVTGRTAMSLSAFGEHLILEEIETAIADAARAIGAGIADFAVGPVHDPRPGRLGGHVFVVEFEGCRPEAAALDRFATILDETLSRLNADYKDHRGDRFGMAAPLVESAAPGSFARWMRARGKLGGQHKVPRVIHDPGMLGSLREAARTVGRT